MSTSPSPALQGRPHHLQLGEGLPQEVSEVRHRLSETGASNIVRLQVFQCNADVQNPRIFSEKQFQTNKLEQRGLSHSYLVIIWMMGGHWGSCTGAEMRTFSSISRTL